MVDQEEEDRGGNKSSALASESEYVKSIVKIMMPKKEQARQRITWEKELQDVRLHTCFHSRVTQGCCFLLLTLTLCNELKTRRQEPQKFRTIISQEADCHMSFPSLHCLVLVFFSSRGLKEMLPVINWTLGNFHWSISMHLFNRSSTGYSYLFSSWIFTSLDSLTLHEYFKMRVEVLRNSTGCDISFSITTALL